jgi:Fe-S-cluster containining protein
VTVQLGPLKFDPTAGPPCHDCSAKCCKYFALQIDKPTTPREHDNIRWYLMHEHIAVWVQDGDWYLEIRTPCRHLQADNSCGIYHTRPQICRSTAAGSRQSRQSCEYFTGNDGTIFFRDSRGVFRLVEGRAGPSRERRRCRSHWRALARAPTRPSTSTSRWASR